jgi:photosystem II cytochrome c550
MLKKNILKTSFFIQLAFFFMLTVSPVRALTLDDQVRTVCLGCETRSEAVLTISQLKLGKYLFGNACASCHIGGITRTDPNVGLDLAALSKSVPRRDCVNGIVSFLRNPRSYDGLVDISEFHPCVSRADLYPKMRSLTASNLFQIAGYILFEAGVLGRKWGGGKIYY